MLGSTRFGQDPRSIRHRRLMPHMLPMPASQISNPIAILILMVTDDFLVHISVCGERVLLDIEYVTVSQTSVLHVQRPR